MRLNFLWFIALFAFTAFAGATTVQTTTYGAPSVVNVSTSEFTLLSSSVHASADTVDTGGVNLFGPVPLSLPNKPMFSYLGIVTDSMTYGDSVNFYYQVVPGRLMTDTVTGNWTQLTSLLSTGKKTVTLIDIQGKVGESLVFKWSNVSKAKKWIFKGTFRYYGKTPSTYIK
jgi:hypothetical protein